MLPYSTLNPKTVCYGLLSASVYLVAQSYCLSILRALTCNSEILSSKLAVYSMFGALISLNLANVHWLFFIRPDWSEMPLLSTAFVYGAMFWHAVLF